MIKVMERSGIQGPYLNIIKAIYSKQVAIINKERYSKQSHKNQGLDKATHFLTTYSTLYMKS